jgi:hypothetical protein
MFATHPALSEAVSYPRPFGIHLFILPLPMFLLLLVGLTYWQLFLSSSLLEMQIGKIILLFAMSFIMKYIFFQMFWQYCVSLHLLPVSYAEQGDRGDDSAHSDHLSAML